MNRHPVTPEELEAYQQEWAEGVPVSQYFPFQMPNGLLVSEIGLTCPVCGCPIRDRSTRGRLVEHPNAVRELRALGLCCETMHGVLVRFRPEGVVEILVGHTWRRMELPEPARPWWDMVGRVQDWLAA